MTGTPDEELLAKLQGDQSVKDEIKRRLDMIDKLLAHCDKDDGECGVCGEIVCPSNCDMHFHHDGCPECAFAEPEEKKKSDNAHLMPSASDRYDDLCVKMLALGALGGCRKGTENLAGSQIKELLIPFFGIERVDRCASLLKNISVHGCESQINNKQNQ